MVLYEFQDFFPLISVKNATGNLVRMLKVKKKKSISVKPDLFFISFYEGKWFIKRELLHTIMRQKRLR